MNAAAIAHRLGGQRQRNNWRCSCPLGCGYPLSLADGEDGQLLAHCFGGCTFDELMLVLVEYGLLDGDDGDCDYGVDRRAGRWRDDSKRIAHARRIYDCGGPDKRIAVYLRSRGIGLTSPVLRFNADTPHRLGARLPAMVAPIVDVTGEQTGVHMTFLRRDGTGKAALPEEYQRECRGVIRGGAIRLSDHDVDSELIIAEGVETALAAMELFGRVGWSAVYAGGLKALELPPAVRSVIIAADNDASGAGQRNALAAYDRWVVEGRRRVSIKLPPTIGTDFNDFLIGERQHGRPSR